MFVYFRILYKLAASLGKEENMVNVRVEFFESKVQLVMAYGAEGG